MKRLAAVMGNKSPAQFAEFAQIPVDDAIEIFSHLLASSCDLDGLQITVEDDNGFDVQFFPADYDEDFDTWAIATGKDAVEGFIVALIEKGYIRGRKKGMPYREDM